MKKINASRWSHYVVLTIIGTFPPAFCANVWAQAAPTRTYQIGDQVEVQWPGDDKWYAAKITDKKDGRYFIVYDQDGNNAWYNPDRIRLVKAAEPPATPPQTNPLPPTMTGPVKAPAPAPQKSAPKPARPQTGGGKVTTDANNTLSADRPVLTGPPKQKRAKNGTRPDPDLLKKIIRYRKGEKPAQKGYDGAVTIDISALQIGSPRRWSPAEDSGSGNSKTIVYPVKVTYTEKTFYRTRTVINANWIRIMNCYVNAFGEWQVGSEEHVKSPDMKEVPRK